jgi:hypothetical protein
MIFTTFSLSKNPAASGVDHEEAFRKRRLRDEATQNSKPSSYMQSLTSQRWQVAKDVVRCNTVGENGAVGLPANCVVVALLILLAILLLSRGG